MLGGDTALSGPLEKNPKSVTVLPFSHCLKTLPGAQATGGAASPAKPDWEPDWEPDSTPSRILDSHVGQLQRCPS